MASEMAWRVVCVQLYDRLSIGSDYMFRVDENTVIDATRSVNQASTSHTSHISYKKRAMVLNASPFLTVVMYRRGSLARYVNHSCDPNCYTAIIPSDGKKKILLYAKRPIEVGEELCYDYKFPIDPDNKVSHFGPTSSQHDTGAAVIVAESGPAVEALCKIRTTSCYTFVMGC